MGKPLDFRKIIIDALEKSGKSRYWLAEQVNGKPAANTVYRYLRGELDVTSEPLAVMLAALGSEATKAISRQQRNCK